MQPSGRRRRCSIVPRIRHLAAATTAATLLTAATASAALAPVERQLTTRVAGGPALSGDRVAWSTVDRAEAVFSVRTAALGGKPSVLYVARRTKKDGELQGVDVALSPSRSVFAFGEFVPVDPEGATLYQRALAGPPAGPFAPVAGDADGRAVVDSLDLSGDALLTTERTSSGIGAFVRDLAAGTPGVKFGGSVVREARIAGDLVAYGETTGDATARVHVVNWRTGVEVFHVDVPITPPYAFGFGLDVQEDGTVAIRVANAASTGSSPRSDLAWASPSQPTLHVVATDVGQDVTRISGGRILFERAHGARARELALASLDGTVRTASFPVDAVVGADLQGSRVALATGTCVYAGDVSDPAPTAAPPGTCPQDSLALDTARSALRGRVNTRVTCVTGTATGCDGTVVLRRGSLVLAERRYHAAPGATVSVGVTMSASRLKSLRRRAGLRRRTTIIDVRAYGKDDAGLRASVYRDATVRLR